MTLSALLAASYALCNRVGRPLALGVFLLGTLMVLAQAVLWVQAGTLLSHQLQVIVGEERYAEVQKAMEGDETVDVEELGSVLIQEMDAKLMSMSDAEKGRYLQDVATDLLQGAGPALWVSALLLALLFLFTRAYFLILAALGPPGFWRALSLTCRRLPGLFGTWIGVGLASCLWLPFMVFIIGFVQPPVLFFAYPSLVFPVVLLPRFYVAPVFSVQGGHGILQSLSASYALTRGKWWQAVSGLVGLSAAVWIVMTVLNASLQFLVQSVLPYSFFGFLLYLLLPFLTLAAVAFRACGLVMLKEGIKGST